MCLTSGITRLYALKLPEGPRSSAPPTQQQGSSRAERKPSEAERFMARGPELPEALKHQKLLSHRLREPVLLFEVVSGYTLVLLGSV